MTVKVRILPGLHWQFVFKQITGFPQTRQVGETVVVRAFRYAQQRSPHGPQPEDRDLVPIPPHRVIVFKASATLRRPNLVLLSFHRAHNSLIGPEVNISVENLALSIA